MNYLIGSRVKGRLDPFTEGNPNPLIGNLSRLCKKKYPTGENGETKRVIKETRPGRDELINKPIRWVRL